jgi:lipooligosaccharide transport system ATP-binding protein
MDEAEVLCDRILIVDRGKIIEEGTPVELVKKHIGEDVLELEYDEKLLTTLKEAFPDARFERLGDRMQIFTDKPHGVFEGFLQEHPLQNVTIRKANIEDVFLKLTGRGLREE